MKVGFTRRPKVASSGTRMVANNYYRSSSSPKTRSPFLKKPKIKVKHRSLTKLIDWLVLIALGFCLVYSLIVKADPTVVMDTSAYHSASVYKDFAVRSMGSVWDKNKLTFNTQNLIIKLQKQFPEISEVKVGLPVFGQRPTLNLSISPPAFLYISQNIGYVISDDGVVVGPGASMPNIKDLPTIIDESNIAIKQGTKIIGSDYVDFINQVIAQARKAKITVASIVLPPTAQEMQLKTTDKPYIVKFYFGNDVNIQTGQWLAARHEFDAKGIAPAEYLDVRVAGKVFYK